MVVHWNPAPFSAPRCKGLLSPLRRITFYLAQTLMAIARHEEAYGWYEKRVALGGWHVSGCSYLQTVSTSYLLTAFAIS